MPPSRLVVGLAAGALDFECHRPQHAPQRQGIDAVGLHDHLSKRIIQEVVNRGFAECWHGVALQKQALKSELPLTNAEEGVTSK